MKYTGSLNPGETIEIDMKNGIVKVNGINVLDKITGGGFKFSPGSNTIIYSDESTNRSLEIEITNNNKYS